MYAIVKIGGKQYRVEEGDSLLVDRMPEEEGATVALEPLMLRRDGDDGAVFAGDDLSKVKVEATVTGHERGKKIHVLKFKPKKGYKRRQGHRSDLTRLEIGDIKMLSRKPAAKKRAVAGNGDAEATSERAPKKKSTAAGGGDAEATSERAPKKKSTAAGTKKKPAAEAEEGSDGT